MRRPAQAPQPARTPRPRLATLALAGWVALGTACGPPVQRVVLVTIDTLRADFVGSYGAARAHTPSLDGLAREGARFATAIAPTPLTLPSHATLMTGLEPPAHGLRRNGGERLPDDLPTLAQRFGDEGFTTAAFVGATVLDRQYGLARGFDVYDDAMSPRQAAGDLSHAERTADRVVDAALAWLEGAPSRFFLWVHLYDPHANYDPPPGFLASFPGDPYAGEVAFADAEVGRLLAAVDARFDDGRTLVLATSDHGESRGEHGELTHSLTIYDATQRVPLLLRGPGVPAGTVVEAPVGLIDVAPTLLAAVGAPALPGGRGLDLRSAFDGGAPGERLLYVETVGPQTFFGWSALLGLRSPSRKYIRAPRPELYDLDADPHEQRNLAAERAEEAARLDAALDERLAATRRAPSLALDEATKDQLEALGYLAPAAGHPELGSVGGIDPKDAMPMALRLMMALQRRAAGRPEEGLALLEAVEGGGWFLAVTRATLALDAGDPAAAEAHARDACAAAPGHGKPWLLLGAALEAQGRLDEAEEAFATAGQRDPSDGEAGVGLGRIAEARGDLERARQLYAEAARARGGTLEAHWRLAALEIAAGDPVAAERALADLDTATLHRAEIAARLARAELVAGRRAEALARLDRALSATPGEPTLTALRDEIAATP